MQLMFSCQREFGINVMCHPVQFNKSGYRHLATMRSTLAEKEERKSRLMLRRQEWRILIFSKKISLLLSFFYRVTPHDGPNLPLT